MIVCFIGVFACGVLVVCLLYCVFIYIEVNSVGHCVFWWFTFIFVAFCFLCGLPFVNVALGLCVCFCLRFVVCFGLVVWFSVWYLLAVWFDLTLFGSLLVEVLLWVGVGFVI